MTTRPAATPAFYGRRASLTELVRAMLAEKIEPYGYYTDKVNVVYTVREVAQHMLECERCRNAFARDVNKAWHDASGAGVQMDGRG